MCVEVALYEPLIPQNTGNIGRLCVGFDVALNLIGPLGFSLDDSKLKRAGLDYWPKLRLQVFDDFRSFFEAKRTSNSKPRILCVSKHGSPIEAFSFQSNDLLLMGQETKGIPFSLTERYGIGRLRLPILGSVRSYNLANATAMVLFESWRQLRWR